MSADGSQPLTLEKHERFAKLVALGLARSVAYEKVGYKPDESHCSRLAKNGRVRARIDFLQRKAAEKTQVTLESMIEDALRIRDLAVAMGQMGPAVGAMKELGILCGFRVEKREQTLKTSPDELSDAELRAIAALGREQLQLEHKPADGVADLPSAKLSS
jgi:phage terminase small subunit